MKVVGLYIFAKITFMKNHYFFLILVLSAFNLQAQIVEIPDPNFKNALFSIGVDTNHDGNIQLSEAQTVTLMVIGNHNITSMEGINSFTNLQTLHCWYNNITSLTINGLNALQAIECSDNDLTSLNITNCNNLQTLNCYRNNLTTLDVTQNPNLQTLGCELNQLTSLNITGLAYLSWFNAGDNRLSSLDLTGCTSFTGLNIYNNLFTSLDVEGIESLTSIFCDGNPITSIHFGNNPLLSNLMCNDTQLTSLSFEGAENIETLACSGNQFTLLDLSKLHNLGSFASSNNSQLTTLILKNGTTTDYPASEYFQFENNPNLQYICADEEEFAQVNALLATYGQTNVSVTSYCIFDANGNQNTVKGIITYDLDANGCNLSDQPATHMRIAVNDGATNGTVYSNEEGKYKAFLNEGNVSLALEAPAYFTVSPPSYSFNFESFGNAETANFCLVPNGNHNDLEVTLLPLTAARPGFDAKYKLIYKNKGTTTQSGQVNLDFPDNVMDFVSAVPMPSAQVLNNLTWQYTDLRPFETRTVELVLNLNSPMETPPVDLGYNLGFAAVISPIDIDETYHDNHSELKQVVVNSFDPNDKNANEGPVISISEAGNYLHYLIRFQNMGSAEAINVVVKDMLAANYDIGSFEFIGASHSVRTTLTSGNRLEFFFEDINLPAASINEPASHGYIAFKIKPATSVGIGSTLENTAGIYFDYNFPVVTEPAVTSIMALGINDVDFSQNFRLYPNPAKELLHIDSFQYKVTAAEIYNALGQLVFVAGNTSNLKFVDVSGLKSGSYFIKLKTDQGTFASKFIKS